MRLALFIKLKAYNQLLMIKRLQSTDEHKMKVLLFTDSHYASVYNLQMSTR